MKALTICQPYAHLIVRGEKRVENREWPTNYRGRLMIHAGKSRSWLEDGDEGQFQALGDPMVFGAIVGLVTLVDCLHIDQIQTGRYDRQYPWLRTHEHTNGTWCWVLQDVERVEPHPCKGSLGLWTYYVDRLKPWRPATAPEDHGHDGPCDAVGCPL